jgi:enoyl-CoA hydratase/carnithine racemase
MSATLERVKPERTEAEPAILFRVVNGVAIIRLNRPQALNALTHEMVMSLSATLRRCRVDENIVAVVLEGAGDKAFCAGGDVRMIHRQVKERDRGWQQFFIDEYRLDYAIHDFPKPVVALLDGVAMGGGMGLAQGAWLRVVTERTKMAMPETRIGLAPDVGATFFMARMSAEIQMYLSLTGRTVSGADAVWCNLADVCVRADWLADFETRLRALTSAQLNPAFPDQLRRSLRTVFQMPEASLVTPSLRVLMPLIRRYFSMKSSVCDVILTLSNDAAGCKAHDVRDWLIETHDMLRQHSPTMLCVTREAMRRGRQMTLAECFRMELGIVHKAVSGGDFVEGVRAHLVDKDKKPRWAPASIWEVQDERVREFMASPWRLAEHPLGDIEHRHP